MPAEPTRGRVLVTGGTGFIGSRVVERLLGLGRDLVVITRNIPRAARWAGRSEVQVVEADLADPDCAATLRRASEGVSAVAHLGGFVLLGSGPGQDDADAAHRANVGGLEHLLGALPGRLDAFILASTLDVYGPPQTVPVTEEQPTDPAAGYARSKLEAESLARVRLAGVGPLAVLRFTQVYGPGDPSTKAIPSFVRASLRGEAPLIYGDGLDVRDYLYVDDAAEAVVAALERRAAGTYNVAAGQGSTIAEAARLVLQAAGSELEPEFRPSSRPPSRIVLDVSRARLELGWSARVALPEGIRRTVEGERRSLA